MRWRIIKSRFKGRSTEPQKKERKIERGKMKLSRWRINRGQAIPAGHHITTTSNRSRYPGHEVSCLRWRKRHLAMSFFCVLLRSHHYLQWGLIVGSSRRSGRAPAQGRRLRAFRCVFRFNYIPRSQTRVTQFCVLQLLSTCYLLFVCWSVDVGVVEEEVVHFCCVLLFYV